MSDRVNGGSDGGFTRRQLLAAAGVAGLGAIAGCTSGGDGTPADGGTTIPASTMSATPTTTDGATTTTEGLPTVTPVPISETPTPDRLTPADVPQAAVRGSHHPGPPRFTSVGAKPLGKVLNDVDVELSGVDGDLAPFNPDREAEFSWSVADAPADSSASLSDTPVVHFEPDVPGTYTLELDAPDGTHQLTVRAFPEESRSDPKPRVSLHGSRDGDQYVFEATPEPSPAGDNTAEDLDVEFYVDDRDKDSFEGTLSVDGTTATAPVDAVTETLRVHAVAVGDRHSVADFVRIGTDGTIAHPNDPPEWIENATMYEIFVRRFGEDVTFEYLQDHLDYIDELGVDVVWLTPILEAHSQAHPNVPGGPHGYDITDYFHTADALGTRQDYEDFVAACHERDIKVIFDLVINHTAREHPYFQAGRNGTKVSSDDKPFFHDLYEWQSPYQALAYFGWSGIPVVDYDDLALRAWMLAVVEEWQPIVDGFRCDVAWGVPRSFWTEVRERLKAEEEDFLLLDETIPWSSEFAEDQFDTHFDYGFYETLRGIAHGSESATTIHDVLDARDAAGYPDYTGFVNYVENHDVDRYLSQADKPVQMAAGAATFTLPGTPMLYYGQETGLTGKRETMNWDDIDQELKSHYENLVAARHSLPELAYDAAVTPVTLSNRPDGVVAYARQAADGQVLVVLNFGGSATTVTLPDGVETTDLLTDEDVASGDGVQVDHAVVLRADDANM